MTFTVGTRGVALVLLMTGWESPLGRMVSDERADDSGYGTGRGLRGLVLGDSRAGGGSHRVVQRTRRTLPHTQQRDRGLDWRLAVLAQGRRCSPRRCRRAAAGAPSGSRPPPSLSL